MIAKLNAAAAPILKDGCNLEELAEILNEMERRGDQAHPSTYASLLRRCGCTKALAQGKHIHEHVKKFHGLQRDRFIGNCLADMYGKCGKLEEARIVFEGIEGKNVFSWTIIIAAYAESENCADALKLLQRMDQEGVKPNAITFTSIIGACSSLGSLVEARALHARIATDGLNLQDVAGTALVNAFGKCGSIDEARIVFEELPRKNAVSWTAIITAYARNGQCMGALEFYHRMVLEGVKPDKVTFVSVLDAAASLRASSTRSLRESIRSSGFESDVVVCTALVNMYAKHGSLDGAKAVFDRMPLRNEVSWNVMIAAYAQSGHISETLSLYWKMNLEGVKPDRSSFTSVLDACASEGALAKGKCIHGNIVVAGLGLDDPLRNVLVNMYGKCGSVEEARAVFEEICKRSVVAWTALMAAYASAGDCKEALTIFRRMDLEGVEPNEITFVVILDACTRLGVAADCKQLHARVLASGFESDPFVANTLLKMYGGCGSLSDARSIFDGMRFKRNVVSWNCMIAAYAQHGYGRESLALYQMMEIEGMKPNEVTFLSILCACSHVGLVGLGRDYFLAFRGEHGIVPMAEHYGCMLDLLGRAGWLDVAEDLIEGMPFRAGGVFWTVLLGACKTHGDVERGARLAERVLQMDLNEAESYVTLSNIYSGAERNYGERTSQGSE